MKEIMIRQVSKLIGYEEANVYHLMKHGLLVRPFKKSGKPKKSIWYEEEVLACLPKIKEYQNNCCHNNGGGIVKRPTIKEGLYNDAFGMMRANN